MGDQGPILVLKFMWTQQHAEKAKQDGATLLKQPNHPQVVEI
jgi:hypothetical protein